MTNQKDISELAGECLNCPAKPCSLHCPLSNDTAGFIKLAKEQKFFEAYRLLSKTTVLPAICGTVCPHEKQCEGGCVKRFKSLPVKIGEIEAYIGNLALANGWSFYPETLPQTDKKVAVVGGGPAGLTCAAFLSRAGVNVTIFEKYNYLGGLLVHGIPDFRLNRNTIQKTIENIISENIEVKLKYELGKNLSLKELEKNYDAVFISIGANVSSKMNVEGETLDGVFGGNEFLEKHLKLELAGKTAVVNGGGNVAMDTARTLARQGAKVYVVYRRSEAEMPAEKKEIADAKNEGIEFLFQNNIVKILGKERVSGVELIRTELIQKPGETRLSPVDIEGSNYTFSADYVFLAIGSKPDTMLMNTLGLNLDKNSRLAISETLQTSHPKVFAGGDIASGKNIGTVALAARSGRDASESILEFLGIKTQF